MHLKQLISAEATEPGRRLLASITKLVNLTLSGSVPAYARDSIFGQYFRSHALRSQQEGWWPETDCHRQRLPSFSKSHRGSSPGQRHRARAEASADGCRYTSWM